MSYTRWGENITEYSRPATEPQYWYDGESAGVRINFHHKGFPTEKDSTFFCNVCKCLCPTDSLCRNGYCEYCNGHSVKKCGKTLSVEEMLSMPDLMCEIFNVGEAVNLKTIDEVLAAIHKYANNPTSHIIHNPRGAN